ncbi:ABC transporter substrate-binding protein [Nesterenkonia natronophila]|uniref:ABC transporter substrate-binding protein n=1 Tax=Nesterenkonia natronophila TaxID=2174932 RepID=A0A3A4FCT6_9MICC|nr:ABC transporter substrate-binding protein [Nesterenkonia natronophila]RJN32897.1 ABC transporter substrate-binding protein [Nesterenkonia natronophila]
MKRISAATAGLALLTLSACGGGDPLETDDNGEDASPAGENGALVVGSQQYYSNTIIAEIYAQVLEQEGYEIQREYEIGQREVYIPELEAGAIDVFPEYTGNLLDYFDPDNESGEADAVHADLGEALPEGLQALDYAEATDQDSYVVTEEFAQEHDLSTVADLAEVDEDLSIAANAEFETRPYGIEGLAETYGVELDLVPVEDSGGPLTLGALLDGEVEVANIYSADPAIEDNDLIILEDTESLVLPQNVVPIVSESVDDAARDAINEVQAVLDQQELLDINSHSQSTQDSPADVAQWWLEDQGMLD